MAASTATYDQNFQTRTNAFTKTGYTFKGWNEKADGTGSSWTTSGVTSPWTWNYTKNITLYAQWQVNQYTITYQTDSGSSTTKKVNYGANALSGVSNPSKSGYTFKGWTTATTATSGTSTISSYTVTGNATLRALFTKTITLSYYNNSTTKQTSTGTQYYNCGTTTNPTFTLSQASKSGWNTRGWSTATAGNASVTYSSISNRSFSADTTVYGLYQKSVSLSYNGNGSTGGSTASQSGTAYYNSSGNTTNPSFTLANNGYSCRYGTFANWTQGSTSGTSRSPGNSLTLSDSTTMYAKWNYYGDLVIWDHGAKNGYSGYTATANGSNITYEINDLGEIKQTQYGISIVSWDKKIPNKYRYVKYGVTFAPDARYGSWFRLGLTLSNSKFTNYDQYGSQLKTHEYSLDGYTKDGTCWVLENWFNIESVTVNDYYINVWSCDMDTYITKVWFTNTV